MLLKKNPDLTQAGLLKTALQNVSQGAVDDWGIEVCCPICGDNYVHVKSVAANSTWDGRGDAHRIAMYGECGHEWVMRLGFHKGQLYLGIENIHETP